MKDLLMTKSFWVSLGAICTGVSLYLGGEQVAGVEMFYGGALGITLRHMGVKMQNGKE